MTALRIAFFALSSALCLAPAAAHADPPAAPPPEAVMNVARTTLAACEQRIARGDATGARTELRAFLAAYADAAPLDAVLHAYTLLGRTSSVLGDEAEAARAYGHVVELWKDPDAAQKTLEAEGAGNLRLGLALTDVGEALFWTADQRITAASAIAMPAYRGDGSKDDVLAFVRAEGAAWVAKRRAALLAADAEHQKILALRPAAPPKWVVRAARRVGQAWGDFVQEYRSMPMPNAWRTGQGNVPGTSITYDELRRSYAAAIEKAASPDLERAKAAFRACSRWSDKYQFSNADTNVCKAWLAAHDPNTVP